MTMKDTATNSYTGYDIDVMTELAKDLGVKVEFVPTDWKTLVSGVTSGKYHMTGSASISPSRAKAAGYSNSYFSLATVPLTLKKNADKFPIGPILTRHLLPLPRRLAQPKKNRSSNSSQMRNIKLSKPLHAISKKCLPAAPMRISHQMSRPISWSRNIQK